MDPATVRQLCPTDDGMMTAVDDQHGKVFALLDQTGKQNNAPIFTTDHGEQLGDHHLLGKIGYFHEGLRIPVVIRGRDNPRVGHIEDAFAESGDVMPTILDWLGAAVLPASIRPMARG